MHGEVTRILGEIERGEPRAAAELIPLVYDELRRLAAARLAREPRGQTLQPTALVHEAYARLLRSAGVDEARWNGRGHFFGAAAEAMRRILIDRARAKRAGKRGAGAVHGDWSLADMPLEIGDSPDDLLDLDEALQALYGEDPAKADLVTLRFYGGLTLEQAGQVLGLSPATADRHWAFARAWLRDRLSR